MYAIVIVSGKFIFIQTKKHKILPTFLILLLTINLIYINSRAAYLGVITGIVYYLSFKFKKYYYLQPTLKKIIILFILCIGNLSMAWYIYSYRADSADGRLLIWKAATQMIREKPLLGWGIDGFKHEYMNFQENYLSENDPNNQLADNVDFPFNEYLRIWVEQGFIGLMIHIPGFLIPFLVISKIKISHYTYEENCNLNILKGVLISFFTFAFFSYPSESLLLVGIPTICMAVLSKNTPLVIQLNRGKSILSLLLSGILIMIYFGLFIPYKKAVCEWNNCLRNIYRSPQEVLFTLDKITPILQNTPTFLLNYGLILNNRQDFKKAKILLEHSASLYANYGTHIELGKSFQGIGKYYEAEQCWKKASGMIPHKFTPLYLRMKMFEQKGLPCEAKRLAQDILRKKIKKPTPTLKKIIKEAEFIINY